MEASRYRLKLVLSSVVLAGVVFLVNTLSATTSPAVATAPLARVSSGLSAAVISDLTPVSTAVRDAAPVVVAARDGGALALYPSAGASTPTSVLPTEDELGSPSVLLAVQRRDDWFQVLLPTRPNGSTAWVRAGDVSTSDPAYEVTVSKRRHQLGLLRRSDGAVVLTSVVGVGAPSRPTPTGEFFVRDLYPVTAPDSPYGPFAFGLSGHSDVLMHFGTGDGRIAIHGTDAPSTIGADASNGCVHVPNDVDLQLTRYLTLGSPVFITD